MDRKTHWDTVYRTKRPEEVSWFQAEAALSLRLIERVVPDRAAPIIDVGGGASVLLSQLDQVGYRNLTVLDLSGEAIAASRAQLGSRGRDIHWIEADLLDAELPSAYYQCWHDRAVFHFLTDATSRAKYVAQARNAVVPGGHLLVATFAADGPTRCSGLDVVRYSPAALHAEFGVGFSLVLAEREEHRTPAGSVQAFSYCLLQRE